MEPFEKYPYTFIAFEISLAAGVIGFFWSIAAVIIALRRRKKLAEPGDDEPSVTWNPFQHVLAFAILWPALLPLSPFFIYLDRRKNTEAIKLAAALAREKGEWPPTPLADKLLYAVIGGIMLLYVAGFFIFN